MHIAKVAKPISLYHALDPNPFSLALAAFRRVADRVPAYGVLLREAGVNPAAVQSLDDFQRLPVLEKRTTFGRFGIEQLCIDGKLGTPSSLLTSSGHSGRFAFGIVDRGEPAAAKWVDNILDAVFGVRTKPTLLINCLPMGVKVHTQACTLAETSVRADMAIALVRGFAHQFAQVIFVGDAAFIKHVLESGQESGIDWSKHRTHVIVGEELLAENARKYLLGLLGSDLRRPEEGMVVSSMGVAEVGLNLFSEAPPVAPLVLLRRTLHENPELRHAVLGPVDCLPSLFTYDAQRIFVEFDGTGRLLLTTLDPQLRIPLIRYATGDYGTFPRILVASRPALEAAGISWAQLESLRIVAIHGRGEHALAGAAPVYPDAVKEGIYHDPSLARLTTANFRLVSGRERVRVRIQLAPRVPQAAEIEERFAQAISGYVRAPLQVACEPYETFQSGMALDYERKFQYLGT